MATMNAQQVTVGAALATGAIWVAPQGTTLPTDAVSTKDAEFTLLGFTSDAGVQISESSTNQTIRAWEARTEVYNVRSEYTESISFMPIQCNADVAALTWGDTRVTVDEQTGAIAAQHSADTLEPVCIIIETTPREGIVKRYCGTFQLTERGAQAMDGTQVDGRQLTFNAIADENGVTMYEYTSFTVEVAQDNTQDNQQDDQQDAPVNLNSMTKAELLAYAAEHGIEGVSESMTNADIIAAIEAAMEG